MAYKSPAQRKFVQAYDPNAAPEFEKNFKEQLKGGRAAGVKPSKFDAKALHKGMQVEMEHAKDPSIALEIAMDHLIESPTYYDALEEMEEKLEKK